MARGGRLLSRTAAARPAWSAIQPYSGWLERLSWLRVPVLVWAGSRLLLLAVTYFGYVLLNSDFHTAHPSFAHDLLPAWNRWDARDWYEQIAQRGYGWTRAAGTGPAAFFPLFPLLIRTVVEVTHRSYPVSALLVSNLCCLGAFAYLWLLAARELGRESANRATLYLAVFPTALFLFAGYTESLFLLLTVGSFYHLRNRQWLAAGLLAGLASATRVTGVLLILPLAYEYARSIDFSWRRITWSAAAVLLAPVGLLAFMLYLQHAIGDPLGFTHYQAAWQKIFTVELWRGLTSSARQILVGQPAASFFQAWNVINLAIALLFLLWSFLAARRLPAAYGIYLAAFWLVTLSSPALAGGYPVPLVSMDRYVLALFPVFLYLGMLGRRPRWHDTYLVTSSAMLAVLTVLFTNGRWVV